MTRQDLKKYDLPDAPGVYLFKRGRETVYVGKATSLKDRVKSYFSKDLVLTRGPKIIKMVEEATSLDWQETDSVLEALILEANLIKKYEPRANTDGKDDKSFNFVVITDEAFPIIQIIRGKTLLNQKRDTNIRIRANDTNEDSKLKIKNFKFIFGPFPHGAELKEALKIIRKIFPFRDEKCPTPPKALRDKLATTEAKQCFNYQIGLCPGTCVGAISKKDYAKVIRSTRLIFEGKKDTLIKDLTRHMNRLAKERKFEEAGEFKKKIFALKHVQDVAMIKISPSYNSYDREKSKSMRWESYDVAHISGQYTMGAMVVMVDGEFKKSDYRKFQVRAATKKFSQVLGNSSERIIRAGNPQTIRKSFSGLNINDVEHLTQILERRLKHSEWPLPDLIIVDGSTAQINAAEKVLRENNLSIPVVGVTKDEKHKARELKGDSRIIHDYHHDIVRLNQETHRFALAYHRQRRDRVVQ